MKYLLQNSLLYLFNLSQIWRLWYPEMPFIILHKTTNCEIMKRFWESIIEGD